MVCTDTDRYVFAMRSSTDNYAPTESARPNDDMSVLEFIIQRQAITRFVRDALQPAVANRKRTQTKTAEKKFESS